MRREEGEEKEQEEGEEEEADFVSHSQSKCIFRGFKCLTLTL